MAIYKQDIVNIDLDSGNVFRSFAKITIGTADKAANRFGIRAFRGNVEADLSGASCYGYFRDPQGNNIALTSYGTVSGNEAYVTLPQACYNYEGQFCLAIKLLVSGVTSTVRIIDGVVDNTNTGGAVAPTGAVPTYSEILSTYDDMVAAVAVANGAIATTFNAANVYPAGSYVINDGALYRITADHAANVTWANTSKTATTLGAEVTDLNSALKLVNDHTITWTDEIYIKSDGSTRSGSSYCLSNKIPVLAGSDIMVRTVLTGVTAICVFNYEGVVVGYKTTDEANAVHDYYLALPATASYIMATCKIANKTDFTVVQGIVPEAINTQKNTNNMMEAIQFERVPLIAEKSYIDLSGSSVTMSEGVPQITGSSASYNCYMMPCNGGDVFTINGEGGSSARLYGFVSSTGSILKVSGSNQKNVSGIVVEAPTDSAFIIIHSSNSGISFKGAQINDFQNTSINVQDYGVTDILLNSRKQIGVRSTGGITFTPVNGSHHVEVVIDGTATDDVFMVLWSYVAGLPEGMEAGRSYYLKFNKGESSGVFFQTIVQLDDNSTVDGALFDQSVKIEIPDNAKGVTMRLYVKDTTVLDDVSVSVSLLKISDVLLSTIETSVGREDILHTFAIYPSSATSKGITYTRNNEGITEYVINGTATGTSFMNLYLYTSALPDGIVPGTMYYLNFLKGANKKIGVRIYIKHSDDSVDSAIYFDSEYITIPKDTTGITIRFNIVKGVQINNETISIELYKIDKMMEEVINSSGNGSKEATMIGFGSSFLTGAVHPEGSLDHYASFDNSPWGNIAIGFNINRNNVKYTHRSSTGLLYDAGNGNFLTTIKNTDMKGYDYLLTEINRPDLGSSFPLGDMTSVAGDGSLAGAVLDVVAYLKSSNPNATLLLVGPPPSDLDPNKSYQYVFTALYGNGHSIAEADILMHRLAVREHFIYADWEDLNLSYYYPDLVYNGSNVHPREDETLRCMGLYLARVMNYATSQVKVLKADFED